MSRAPVLVAALLLCVIALAGSAQAASTPSVQSQLDALREAVAQQKAQIDAQQKLLEAQAAEIERLRASAAQAAPEGGAKEPATQEEVAAVRESVEQAKIAARDAPKVSMTAGRPTITSADGRSSLAVRAVVQFDMADYQQSPEGAANADFRRGSVGATANRETTAAKDLSNGAYFRRARLGVEGTIARDFNYKLMFELGGAGTEGPTRINDAYINYTGFAPWTIQLGAFSPAANMDDGTGVEDLVFIERATPAELSRTLGGADSRLGLGIRDAGTRWMSSLTLTSRTVNDAEVFDSQFAAVGRASWLALTGADYNLHLGLSGTNVLKPADQGSATTPRYAVRFRDRPEIRVDSTRLIDTGSIDADSVYAAGAEFGAQWKSWYLQAEDFRYGIKRREPTVLSNPSFGGWYAQGSWILTGETRRYSVASGSFASPRPFVPFTMNGGRGAWELAARYSHTDLNHDEGIAGLAPPSDGIRGGVQNIWTFGVNWYVNPNLRLMFNYLRINVDRLNPAGSGNLTPFGAAPGTPPIGVQIGQNLEVFALRSQYSF